MRLFLIRHADAGSRSGWDRDDRVRPLSPLGEKQAAGIERSLSTEPITRVLSSPAVRCVQTVAPLAAALGVEVETCELLFEGAWARSAIELAESLDETVVFSSHGDLIPQMIRGLVDRGMTLLDDFRWPKSSTWVVARDGEKFTTARYLGPPT